MADKKSDYTKPVIVSVVLGIFLITGIFLIQQKKNEDPIIGNDIKEVSEGSSDNVSEADDTQVKDAGAVGKNEVKLTDDNFEKEVLKYKGVFVVDFYISTCPACQSVAEKVTAASDALVGKAKVGKIEAKESKIAEKYKIESVPTFIVFKNGKEVDREVGVHTKDELVSLAKKNF